MAKMGLLVVAMMGFGAGCGAMAPTGSYKEASAPPPQAYAFPQQPQYAAAASAAPAATMAVPVPAGEVQGTEAYKDYGVNPIVDPAKDRFSTFAIDVDTASYAISRRKLLEGALPPYQSVRAEEYLNYFDYAYPAPKSGPFAVHFASAPSPFQKGHQLLRVALQAKRIDAKDRKPVHLVYLVDTSGSMQSDDKIGLAKKSLRLLTDSLKPGDTVALCTYAGDVREVLAPTGIDQKGKILQAIDDLTSGGSTAMASGLENAYRLASSTLVKGHVNRVVVLSDGDANVGATSHEEILKQIESYKEKGVTLSTVGFGSGNYKDTMMEQLADKGDGNYSYIDSAEQAKRVFSEQVGGMLEVVAKDVKIQVEFDPSVVQSYRLIGYENRDIADKDFRNDKVDAGEVGAGHAVTAMYDVVLKSTTTSPVTVRLRAKGPDAKKDDAAVESTFKMSTDDMFATFDKAPQTFRFASAVTGFAEILRQSPAAKEYTLDDVAKVAIAAAGDQRDQQEMVTLVKKAASLKGGSAPAKTAN
ncbi:MAG: von Willebrand factor type A domain-containing protein [Polyangiaceae bacterium]